MSNIQYATRRFTIPAGESLTTIRDSNFVTCLDAGGPFRVRFDDGPESDFEAGLTYSPDGGFSRLEMRNTNPSAIDVFLGFGKGNINDARVTISSGQVLQVSANSPDTFEAGAAVSCDDGSTTVVATLPANSQIFQITVDVTTAFDAGTTNTLDIGDGSTANLYADALAAGSQARVLATSDVSQIGNLIDIGTSDVDVTVTYNQTGTAATAGAATVTVLYLQNRNLS